MQAWIPTADNTRTRPITTITEKPSLSLLSISILCFIFSPKSIKFWALGEVMGCRDEHNWTFSLEASKGESFLVMTTSTWTEWQDAHSMIRLINMHTIYFHWAWAGESEWHSEGCGPRIPYLGCFTCHNKTVWRSILNWKVLYKLRLWLINLLPICLLNLTGHANC